MSNFGVQTRRVLASGALFWPLTWVRVRAVVMSSTTWYQRRVDNIVLTTDYKKSQRCYPPHGTMKKKCDVWLSLCYLPLASQAILPNVKIRFPNGSSGAVFWPVTRVRVRVRVRAVVMSSTTWYQRRVDNIVLTIDYKKKSKMLSTAWYYEEKNVIYSFRYVIYPSEVKRFCGMSHFGVQTGRVFA